MFLSRRVLAITSVFSLVVLGMYVITHESAPPPRPTLPLGKVQPYLWTDMLLAPDGSLWALEHSGTGRPGSVTLNPISPGNDWKTVSGVAGYGVGVKEDGTLWLWQPGGAPSSSTRLTPVQIGLERDWAYASHSWNYAPLLKQDGSLWYLGDEYIDSKTPPSPLKPAMRPSRIGSDNDWVRIANCNGVHYALKKDGTLWHWGRAGHHGPYATTPQLLSPDKDWASMSRGSFILALIKQDGSLWITGQGAGTVASDHVAGSVLDPVRIGNDNHWQEAVGGESSLLVRHTDGSWWSTLR